jgi:hypothetical protein
VVEQHADGDLLVGGGDHREGRDVPRDRRVQVERAGVDDFMAATVATILLTEAMPYMVSGAGAACVLRSASPKPCCQTTLPFFTNCSESDAPGAPLRCSFTTLRPSLMVVL